MVKLFLILTGIIFLLLSPFAKAEYRAFMLKITAPNGQDYRLVKSTLDHIQYPIYHPIDSKETITYIETWRCRGNTSEQKPICMSPSELKQASSLSPDGTQP
ncbi:MAG: hypothetical protein BroJett040_24620 [Oligoflexia bacterium]|nr:MAG: hypothetical protein BroJett040_24620 [Oligoflexia bacterium]